MDHTAALAGVVVVEAEAPHIAVDCRAVGQSKMLALQTSFALVQASRNRCDIHLTAAAPAHLLRIDCMSPGLDTVAVLHSLHSDLTGHIAGYMDQDSLAAEAASSHRSDGRTCLLLMSPSLLVAFRAKEV